MGLPGANSNLRQKIKKKKNNSKILNFEFYLSFESASG